MLGVELGPRVALDRRQLERPDPPRPKGVDPFRSDARRRGDPKLGARRVELGEAAAELAATGRRRGSRARPIRAPATVASSRPPSTSGTRTDAAPRATRARRPRPRTRRRVAPARDFTNTERPSASSTRQASLIDPPGAGATLATSSPSARRARRRTPARSSSPLDFARDLVEQRPARPLDDLENLGEAVVAAVVGIGYVDGAVGVLAQQADPRAGAPRRAPAPRGRSGSSGPSRRSGRSARSRPARPGAPRPASSMPPRPGGGASRARRAGGRGASRRSRRCRSRSGPRARPRRRASASRPPRSASGRCSRDRRRGSARPGRIG